MPKKNTSSRRRRPAGRRSSQNTSRQPRRTRVISRAQPRQSSGYSTAKTSVAMAICSKINPFCKESLGAKISDESSVFTVCFQTRDLIPLTSDANGDFAYYFSPMPHDLYKVGSTIAAHLVTAWTSNTSGSYVSITNQYQTIRVVSYGVRIVTTQAWTSATGNTIFSVVNANPPVSSTNTTTMTNGTDVSAYALRDLDVTFLGKPADHTYTEFQTVLSDDGSPGDAGTPNWTQLLVTGSGLTASTNFGFAEIVVNLECRPITGAGIASNQYATVSSPPNHGLTALVDMTRYGLPNILDTSFAKSVEKIVYNAAIKSAQAASPALLQPAFAALMM
jgi:hypothetical protein